MFYACAACQCAAVPVFCQERDYETLLGVLPPNGVSRSHVRFCLDRGAGGRVVPCPRVSRSRQVVLGAALSPARF